MLKWLLVPLGVLAFQGPAPAAEPARGPHCMKLETAQKAAGKDTAVVALSPAQFHFLQGFYVRDPATPDGLPPGDGALVLLRDKGGSGLVLWTRGTMVCEPMAVSAVGKLLKLLADVKQGAGADGDAL